MNSSIKTPIDKIHIVSKNYLVSQIMFFMPASMLAIHKKLMETFQQMRHNYKAYELCA